MLRVDPTISNANASGGWAVSAQRNGNKRLANSEACRPDLLVMNRAPECLATIELKDEIRSNMDAGRKFSQSSALSRRQAPTCVDPFQADAAHPTYRARLYPILPSTAFEASCPSRLGELFEGKWLHRLSLSSRLAQWARV